jgi:hypothetical protein
MFKSPIIQLLIFIIIVALLFRITRKPQTSYTLPTSVEMTVIQRILANSDSTVTYKQVERLIDSANLVYTKRIETLEKSYAQHLHNCVVINNKLVRLESNK